MIRRDDGRDVNTTKRISGFLNDYIEQKGQFRFGWTKYVFGLVRW